MKKILFAIILCCLLFTGILQANVFDAITESISRAGQSNLDNDVIISGLKEALSIGAEKAVQSVSRKDGFFGNEIIKIIMPEKMQNVVTVLNKLGLNKQVDEFVMSMNRAAEKAAPEAASILVDSVKEMSIQDAQEILAGNETAATTYFKEKTTGKLHGAFKPIISSAMNEVGVTKMYKDLISTYSSVPFTQMISVDLDDYVTDNALEGLFYMLGEEEKKIRKDPAARVTELLQTVFSGE